MGYIYSRGYYAVIDNDLKSSIIRHTGLLEGDIMDLIGYMVREEIQIIMKVKRKKISRIDVVRELSGYSRATVYMASLVFISD